MEIFAGFILGFLGSVHCAGMCGPLVLALPNHGTSKIALLRHGLIYHTGKALAYSTLGAAAGLIGHQIQLAGFQQTLSVGTGSILLATTVLPSAWKQKIFSAGGNNFFFFKFKVIFRRILQWPGNLLFLGLGFLNGFLPCGLVYVALGGALLVSTAWDGSIFMALFGLGTMPMLLAIYLARNLVHSGVRLRLRRWLPLGVALVAGLLILRGLSLGIPYLSPDLNPAPATPACCH